MPDITNALSGGGREGEKKQCNHVDHRARTRVATCSCVEADPLRRMADMRRRLTETSPQCAAKSLAGRGGRLCPGCELHSHYFDPRSDDTGSFVELCVENAAGS